MEAYKLKAREMLMLYEYVMSETHDSSNAGVKHQDRFYLMLERPEKKLFGQKQFPNVFEKACVYLHSISTDHIFINGNKRTAAYVFLTYLEIHGLTFTMTNKKLEDYVVELTIHQKYKENDAIKNMCKDLQKFIDKIEL